MLEQYALSDRLTLRYGYDQVNKPSLGLLANHLCRITAPLPSALTYQNLYQNCAAVISLLTRNRSKNEQWSTADTGRPVCYRFCHMHLTNIFGMHERPNQTYSDYGTCCTTTTYNSSSAFSLSSSSISAALLFFLRTQAFCFLISSFARRSATVVLYLLRKGFPSIS